MYLFREVTPTRRANRKECKHYNSYRNTLREDFNKRCGYCNSNDKFRIRTYTIDHFVPQNPKDFKHDIKPNDYYNLVYSCSYCNTYKSNKWPTKDACISNDGRIGFVDPTKDEYSNLFIRSKDGEIEPANHQNDLAHYIKKELFLWLPVHKNMWRFEKLKALNQKIRTKLKLITDNNLRDQLEKDHYYILLILDEIQDNIFLEND